MQISTIRQKAYATPQDHQQAIDLLGGAIEPIIAEINADIARCQQAVEKGDVIALAMATGLSEEVVMAMGHHGAAFIGSLRMSVRKSITDLPTKAFKTASISNPHQKLELVDDSLINEEIAASALIHRVHATTQSHSQALATRLSRIWPKAYITENDVPISAAFMVTHILQSLRVIDRQFMTSQARIDILKGAAFKWLSALGKSAETSNQSLANNGWLPRIDHKDIASWKNNLLRFEGSHNTSARNNDVKSTESQKVSDYQEAPRATFTKHHVKADTLLSSMHFAPVQNDFADNERTESSFGYEELDLGTIPAITTMVANNLLKRYEKIVSESLPPLLLEQNSFAEPVLSHIQEVVRHLEDPKVLNTVGIVNKEAAKRNKAPLSDGHVKRMIAAQQMMHAILADKTIPSQIKPFLVKFQIPWTRYILSHPDSLASINDPFKNLLWRVCVISRRSSEPLMDGTKEILLDALALFDRATIINSVVIEKAAGLINDKWSSISRRSKLVLDRAKMAWQGEATVEQVKDEIRSTLRTSLEAKFISAQFGLVIDKCIVPSLVVLRLKQHLSEQDKSNYSQAQSTLSAFIDYRTGGARLTASQQNDLYEKCERLILDCVGDASALIEDRQAAFKEIAATSGESAIGTASAPSPGISVAQLLPIKTDKVLSQHHNAPTEYIEKARKLNVGAWLHFQTAEKEWRGKLAARIEFKNTVVIADRNGMKIDEVSHEQLAEYLYSKTITVVDDLASFSKALESIVVSVRKAKLPS